MRPGRAPRLRYCSAVQGDPGRPSRGWVEYYSRQKVGRRDAPSRMGPRPQPASYCPTRARKQAAAAGRRISSVGSLLGDRWQTIDDSEDRASSAQAPLTLSHLSTTDCQRSTAKITEEA